MLTLGSGVVPITRPYNAHSVTPEQYGAVGDGATDDSAAIEAAIFAVVAAAIADGSYACEVVFAAEKIYAATRAPQVNATHNGLTSLAYAQIALPYVAWDFLTGSQKVVNLTIRSTAPRVGSNATFTAQACAIKTTYTTVTAYSASNGVPSVVGGAQVEQNATLNSSQHCNGLHVIWDGVNIIQPTNPVLTGVDLYKCWAADVQSLQTYTPTNGFESPPTKCTNPAVFGLRMNCGTNAGFSNIEYYTGTGNYIGVQIGEHATVKHLWLYANRISVQPDNALGGTWVARIDKLHSAWHDWVFAKTHGVSDQIDDLDANSALPMDIQALGLEGSGQLIKDASNLAQIRAFIHNAGNLTLAINGGGLCKFTDLNQPAGAVTAPGIPASTSAYVSTYRRNAYVEISGGTVTVVAVDGVSTGRTSGAFFVPASKSITLTYSVAPTWKWWLLA